MAAVRDRSPHRRASTELLFELYIPQPVVQVQWLITSPPVPSQSSKVDQLRLVQGEVSFASPGAPIQVVGARYYLNANMSLLLTYADGTRGLVCCDYLSRGLRFGARRPGSYRSTLLPHHVSFLAEHVGFVNVFRVLALHYLMFRLSDPPLLADNRDALTELYLTKADPLRRALFSGMPLTWSVKRLCAMSKHRDGLGFFFYYKDDLGWLRGDVDSSSARELIGASLSLALQEDDVKEVAEWNPVPTRVVSYIVWKEPERVYRWIYGVPSRTAPGGGVVRVHNLTPHLLAALSGVSQWDTARYFGNCAAIMRHD